MNCRIPKERILIYSAVHTLLRGIGRCGATGANKVSVRRETLAEGRAFSGSVTQYKKEAAMFNCNKMLFMLAAMGVIFFSAGVYADDVADSINEALQYYKEGRYSEAIGSLNYASQLIGQKKGGALQSFLPEPLQGWAAEESNSQAVGAQVFGGGITAERTYTKDAASLAIRIVTDSPLLQGMMMMFTNPMMATADGGKLEKIRGEKAIVKYNSGDQSGNINIVIAGRLLITVEGSGVRLEDLKAYAGAVDYKKLATLQ
jgi:hypothetical protein